MISNYPGSQCRQAATRVKLEICRPGLVLHAVIMLHAVIVLHGVAAGLRKRRQGHRQETHGHESTNQLFHKILLVVLD